MTLDWLIVGGGIHGVHLAARLIGQAGVAAERLRIVDPAERLLARWRACTSTTGMSHLRSASVQHLDLEPWSLQRFAGKRKVRQRGLFVPPYERPALKLFDAHCDQVIETFGLADLHLRDRALTCELACDGVQVTTSEGQALEADNVLLAIGAGEQPEWPDWALRDHPRVQHIFDPCFAGLPCSGETVAVIGGGISAAQTALRLRDEGHQVHLVSRHPLREHQFDSDPGWLGARYMTGFQRERDLGQRRSMITRARHRGSVSPEVHRALRHAIAGDEIRWLEGDVEAITPGCETVHLQLSCGAAPEVERVLLATGFAPRRPGGAMLDALVDSASLPCADCGYPIVDAALRWHPRVYVTGPLAELELGPASRNIAGARRAGDRLVAAVGSGGATRGRRAS